MWASRFHIRGRFCFGVFSLRVVHAGDQVLEQRGEFEFSEEVARELRCRVRMPHRSGSKLDRHVAVNGRHFAAERACCRLFSAATRDTSSSRPRQHAQQVLERAEALDQLHRTFVANAGRAGNVVDEDRHAGPLRQSTRSGRTPRISSTLRASQIKLSLGGFSTQTTPSPAAACPCRWRRRRPESLGRQPFGPACR